MNEMWIAAPLIAVTLLFTYVAHERGFSDGRKIGYAYAKSYEDRPTEAHAQPKPQYTAGDIPSTDALPPQTLEDLMKSPHGAMDCYMESFNTRKLCALLGDTPGCVKWLAEHPDASKDGFE